MKFGYLDLKTNRELEFGKDSESELVQKQPIDLASGLRVTSLGTYDSSESRPKSCDRPKSVLDGKLSEQLEMKMRTSWSPQKNFHHLFFLLSVREVLAVDKK